MPPRTSSQRTATSAKKRPAGNVPPPRGMPPRTGRPGPPVAGIIAVVVVIALVLGLIAIKLKASGGTSSTVQGDNQPVPASVLTALQQIPASTFESVGKGKTVATPIALPGPALESGGKPELLYVGAEYCPYCAAERWGLVVALSRFGTFSGLELMTSSSTDVYPSTPTFTFVHATYSSQYLSFSSVELQSNKKVGASYPTLQKMTPEQSQLFDRFDAPPYVAANATGTIPFVDVANRYMFNGSPYSPQVLHGETWEQIAQALQDPSNADAQNIIGTANVLTAAICAVTNNQPAAVCSSTAIQQLRPAGA